jgi:hypothetical protein
MIKLICEEDEAAVLLFCLERMQMQASLFIKVRKGRVYFKLCGKHSPQCVDENAVTAMLNEE